MEFIANLPLIGGLLSSLIGFVIVLGIVVFVHEYGHYIVGRWCGIHADTFSMGFGPVLKSWVDKRGTRWQIAALPLGGYVKFLGDADGASRTDHSALADMSVEDRTRSFPGAAIWKRSLTVAAGPFFNFFLSIAIFTGVIFSQGTALPDPIIGKIESHPGLPMELTTGDKVLTVNGEEVEVFGDIFNLVGAMPEPGPVEMVVERDGETLELTLPYLAPPLVGDVRMFGAAARAGLEDGDLITAVDGQPIISFFELQSAVTASEGKTLTFEILRGEEQIELAVTPKVEEDVNQADFSVEQRVMIGVSSGGLFLPTTETPTLWAAVGGGVGEVIRIIDSTFKGIQRMIEGVLSPKNLQGPVGIAQMSGDQVSTGLIDAIYFIGVISTAIGLLNLFPIPVLDGGHLVMFGYEALSGKPPAEKVMRVVMTFGLSMVLLLMVFATYNDLVRLFVS